MSEVIRAPDIHTGSLGSRAEDTPRPVTPLIDAPGPPSWAGKTGPETGRAWARRQAAAASTPIRALILADSFFPPARNGRSRAAMLADYGSHRIALGRELAARGARPRPRPSTARAMRSLAQLGLRPRSFHATARAVRAPVLVVHGRRDHHVPVHFASAATAQHSSWTSRIIEDGSHDAHIERPADWLAAVSAWLDALSAEPLDHGPGAAAPGPPVEPVP